MANDVVHALRQEIMAHEANRQFSERGHEPLFVVSPAAKIVIVGQAPGIRAQASGKPWDDASGTRLVQWLGVSEETFRDPEVFAHLPMDFYYPGKGVSGDLPPRKGFAELWHKKALALMPNVRLVVLAGRHAQKHYLGVAAGASLTGTVQDYQRFLPAYFPLVHPSPLNFRWHAKNPWFEAEVVPALQCAVADIIAARG